MTSDVQHRPHHRFTWFALLHYIYGAVMLVYSGMLLYEFSGIYNYVPLFSRPDAPDSMTLAYAILIAQFIYALCIPLAGWFFSRRTHARFCWLVTLAHLIFIPIGTLIGLAGIIVLTRPAVREQFRA